MRLVPLLLALPLLGAAPAATPITIGLANYRFEPTVIRLQHGQPYVFHLVNASTRSHNFVAPEFFAAARVGRREVEVKSGAAADIAIIAPAPGRYPVRCTHFTHAMRGMKGEIVVD